MAGFAYSAISIDGLETVGEIHAPDLEGAREQLRIRGLLAHSLRELAASGDDGLRTASSRVSSQR
jgi:type II secretory pathway component PulF